MFGPYSWTSGNDSIQDGDVGWDAEKTVLYINAYVTNAFYRTNLTWYQRLYEHTAADDIIACREFEPLRY